MPSLEVGREDLAVALKAIGTAKSSEPPFAHLTKLTVGTGSMSIEGCRPEARAESSVATAGAIASGTTMFLPREAFARCTDNAVGHSITISESGMSSVRFESDDFMSNLPLARSFSAWPQWESIAGHDIPTSLSDWRQILRVCFAASDDRLHPTLLGVRLEGTTASATDKRRIARAELSGDFPPVTVPTEFLAHVDRFMHGDCTVRVGSRSLSVSVGQHRWTSSLLAADFPSLERHLAERDDDLLTVSSAALQASLNRVSVFGRETFLIVLEVADVGTLSVTALGPEASIATDRLACGGPWTGRIGCNLRVLTEAVEAAATDTVSFGILTDPLNPVLVRQEKFTQLLMPTRVPSA